MLVCYDVDGFDHIDKTLQLVQIWSDINYCTF